MILLVLLVAYKGDFVGTARNRDASEPSEAAQARQRMQAHLLLGVADGAELALGFLDGLGQGCIALQGRGYLVKQVNLDL